MSFRWTGAAASRHSTPVLALLALIAGLFAGVPSWAGTVQDVRISRDRIVPTFDDRVAAAC